MHNYLFCIKKIKNQNEITLVNIFASSYKIEDGKLNFLDENETLVSIIDMDNVKQILEPQKLVGSYMYIDIILKS